MKTLITGTNSGLGQYLSKRYQKPTCVTRMTRLPPRDESFDLIIHCAADPRHAFPTKEIEEYWHSNFGLLSELLQLRSTFFVFISSIECAPFQDEVTSSANPYIFTKLVQEMATASVRKARGQYLILRPSMLIGKHMRENSITKVLKGQPVRVAKDSEFNCVSYADVAGLIQECVEKNITGTLDVCSTRNVRLVDLSANYDRPWGEYIYKCPAGEPGRAQELSPGLRRTSKEVIEEWQKSVSSSQPS